MLIRAIKIDLAPVIEGFGAGRDGRHMLTNSTENTILPNKPRVYVLFFHNHYNELTFSGALCSAVHEATTRRT